MGGRVFDLIEVLQELEIVEFGDVAMAEARHQKTPPPVTVIKDKRRKQQGLDRVFLDGIDNYPINAGFFRRFAAFVIDLLILNFFGLFAGLFYGFMYADFFSRDIINSNQVVVNALVFGLLWGVVSDWLYFTSLESSGTQATLGKVVLGIIVTDVQYHKIDIGRANMRYWCKFVSALIFGVGFIMAGVTKKKQALHDKIVGTLVIVKPRRSGASFAVAAVRCDKSSGNAQAPRRFRRIEAWRVGAEDIEGDMSDDREVQRRGVFSGSASLFVEGHAQRLVKAFDAPVRAGCCENG